MKYVLLIYDEERTWGKLSPADQQAMMAEYRKFTEEVKASGQYVGGSQLHPVSAASSVRVREGKRLVTDGPFAETREQLGGYLPGELRESRRGTGARRAHPVGAVRNDRGAAARRGYGACGGVGRGAARAGLPCLVLRAMCQVRC